MACVFDRAVPHDRTFCYVASGASFEGKDDGYPSLHWCHEKVPTPDQEAITASTVVAVVPRKSARFAG